MQRVQKNSTNVWSTGAQKRFAALCSCKICSQSQHIYCCISLGITLDNCLQTPSSKKLYIMNFIFLIVIIYSLGMASTKDISSGRVAYKGYKLLSLRDEPHQIDGRKSGSAYKELLNVYPHRERAKNFVFHAQSQIKARDVEDDEPVTEYPSGTWDESALEASPIVSPRYSDTRKPKVVLYSKKSWIKDYLALSAEEVEATQSESDRNEIEIDVDLLIEYLITQGFSEEDLQFLKTNLDYGFDEIERELRKIKDNNTKKNKHISIGGEHGDDDKEQNDKDNKDDNSPKSNSNSLKASLKVLCLTFILVTYII
ncbi:unnamed protein product [Debaryomyces tyrocola]|nr:unnamed protein product [Debaryomyces tyrocola]